MAFDSAGEGVQSGRETKVRGSLRQENVNAFQQALVSGQPYLGTPISCVRVPDCQLHSWLQLPVSVDPRRPWCWFKSLIFCHLQGRFGCSSWLVAIASIGSE